MDIPAPLNPAGDADIEAVRAAVAPLRIPDDLERLWRRLQDGPDGMIDRLDLLPMSSVLEFRAMHDWPNALLTVAYESHQFRLVELDDADGTGGGMVWEAEFSVDDIREVAPSLPALIDAVATAWEVGIAHPYEVGGFRALQWDFDAWERRKADLWPTRHMVPAQITRWLPRWLAIQGMDPADARPRGATMTIAALRELGAAWTDSVTLSGAIRGLAGTMEGSAGPLDDGTGRLIVFVPPSADPFRLLQNGTTIELDVRPFDDGVVVGPTFDRSAFEAVATAVRRDDA
jgi:hypothetical protein